jgi:hypothetical protein
VGVPPASLRAAGRALLGFTTDSLEPIPIQALELSGDPAECCSLLKFLKYLKLMSERRVMRRKPNGDPTNANLNQSHKPWELAKSRFLEDLEPHERDLFDNATLENIYYSTSNVIRDNAEKSKTRAAARKLAPLIAAIESYGCAGDTITQLSPQYLSPIWGSIRIVLVAASSYNKFYDKLVDTLGRIGDILPRFRTFRLYPPSATFLTCCRRLRAHL